MAFGLLAAGSLAAQTPAQTPPAAQPPAAEAPFIPPAPPPTPTPTPDNLLHLDLSTGGRVTLQLRPDVAPGHVERIKTLARQGFYNGVIFHRVIEGFMAQTGDPTGTGEGGSQLPDLKAEFNGLPHLRGTISMARTASPDSANSQFFVMLMPRLTLDARYTAFGRVISGMSFVDAIEKGEPPANPSRILRASIGSDNVPPPAPGEVIPTPSAPRPDILPAPTGIVADPLQAPSPAPSPAAPLQ